MYLKIDYYFYTWYFSLLSTEIECIIYLFIYLPAFLDTGLPRGNVHERDSGPMRGAIPTQSHNPWRLATPPGLRPLLFLKSDVGSFTSHKNKSVKVLWDGTYIFSSLSQKTRRSNHLQMSLQRQHFLLSFYKDPECWSGQGLKPWPPNWPALSQLS